MAAGGDLIHHSRGKTVTGYDSVTLSLLSMNTSSAHFDDIAMFDAREGQTVVFGALVAATVIGLTMEAIDAAFREVGVEDARFRAPVTVGDTLRAVTKVLSKHDGPDGRELRLHHWGINQRAEIVFECDRTVLLPKNETER